MIKCTSKSSRLGQFSRWEVLECFLSHSSSIDPLVYCGTEQSLWCKESYEHPGNTKQKAIGAALACDGYVEVQSVPYTYDNGAEAEGEDPKCVPLLRTFNPQKRRVAWSDGSD